MIFFVKRNYPWQDIICCLINLLSIKLNYYFDFLLTQDSLHLRSSLAFLPCGIRADEYATQVNNTSYAANRIMAIENETITESETRESTCGI